MTHESISVGAIPLIATSQQEYFDAVLKTVLAANQVYQEFLKSEEGQGFSGQIIMIGDSMGSLLSYDALTRHSHSGQYANEDDAPPSPGKPVATGNRNQKFITLNVNCIPHAYLKIAYR